jgi:hypothetical protein
MNKYRVIRYFPKVTEAVHLSFPELEALTSQWMEGEMVEADGYLIQDGALSFYKLEDSVKHITYAPGTWYKVILIEEGKIG